MFPTTNKTSETTVQIFLQVINCIHLSLHKHCMYTWLCLSNQIKSYIDKFFKKVFKSVRNPKMFLKVYFKNLIKYAVIISNSYRKTSFMNF